MADVPITIIAGTLPSGAVYNAQTLFNAMVARMTATVSGGNILFGQLGGSQPGSALPGSGTQAGLWFGNALGNNGIWQDWNTAASMYLPIPVTCGQFVGSTLRTTDILCGAVSGSWKIVTPDKAGVIALLSDVAQVSFGTQTFTGIDVTPDWSNRGVVYIVESGAGGVLTVRYPANASDGQTVDYYIENPGAVGGATYTVNWVNVWWPGNTTPTPSAWAAGHRKIDHYRLQFAGNLMFGSVVAQGYDIGVGVDTIVPTVTTITGQGTAITITVNYNLRGSTAVPVADFTVIKNGVSQTISSATVSGKTVIVNLSTAMAASDTVTIQYSGSDLVSIATTPVANFGPSSVALVNLGTPSTGGGGGGLFNHYLP